MTVANTVRSWFGNMPTHELTDKVVQTSALIKNSINEVIPDENDELNDIAEDFIYIGKQVWLLMRLTTQVMFTKLIILVSAIPLFCWQPPQG